MYTKYIRFILNKFRRFVAEIQAPYVAQIIIFTGKTVYSQYTLT